MTDSATADIRFRVLEVDDGFCRVVYQVVVDGEDVQAFYALQDEGGAWGVKAYRCTPDYFEPECEVVLKRSHVAAFELPAGGSETEVAVRRWLLAREEGSA